MKYDELLAILRECNDCRCEEHCPYHEERNNPLRCMTKIVGDAADAIDELQSQLPKWIHVSERLPKQYSKVLVFVDGHGVVTASLGFDERWNTNNIGIGITKNVTHWMPLPEMPKDGE